MDSRLSCKTEELASDLQLSLEYMFLPCPWIVESDVHKCLAVRISPSNQSLLF